MKNKFLNIFVAIILLCTFLLCGCTNSRATKTVFILDNNKISQAEYDYYYNSYYKMYIDNFSAFFEYMGVDSNEDLESQEYEAGKTFGELFKECTIDQIKQIYVLYNDGIKNDFVFNSDEKYQEYYDLLTSSLEGSKYSINDYFKNYYGKYANEKLISEYLKMGFYANAYFDYLIDNSSYDEAYEYVQELKDGCIISYD